MGRYRHAVAIELDEADWRVRQQAHEARVDELLQGRRERRLRGEHHPVQDFLFEYYPYSAGKVRAWHPGPGVELLGDVSSFLNQTEYVQTDCGATLGPLSKPRVPRIALAIRILEGTMSRPAQHSCFGLHEWAMVDGLQQSEIRHEQVPLRLAPEAITAVIDDVGLRCTHIDAYRFFTTASTPKNPTEPTRINQPDIEQGGCIHANMDLYKYAMWATPWIASEIVADCFELAMTARELDMAASPYDVSVFGVAPIPIETSAGRAIYASAQREVTALAEPIRERLLTALRLATAAAQATEPHGA